MSAASPLRVLVVMAWWIATATAWLSAAAFLAIGLLDTDDNLPFLAAAAIAALVGAGLLVVRHLDRRRALARARARRGPPVARVVRGG